MSNSHIFVKTGEKQMKKNNQQSLILFTLGIKTEQMPDEQNTHELYSVQTQKPQY